MLVMADMHSATAVYVLERLFRLVEFLTACFESWKGSSRLVEILKARFDSWKDLSQLVEVQQQ